MDADELWQVYNGNPANLIFHKNGKTSDWINLLNTDPVYLRDFVITMPADGLAPDAARPSAGRMLANPI